MTTPLCHIWERVPHQDTTQESMVIAFGNLALWQCSNDGQGDIPHASSDLTYVRNTQTFEK